MDGLDLTNIEAAAAGVASRFALPSPPRSVEPYGSGLVNATFLVISDELQYILQRLNDVVFPQPERIMSNLSLLQGHLAAKASLGLRIPALIPAKDGLLFVRDEDGGIWRLMEAIPSSRVLSRIDSLEQAREVGRILGRFHVLVGDLPASRLAVTLPGFHLTPCYLQRLEQVLAGCASAQREEISQLIAFAVARRAGAGVLEDARRQGRIRERVVHGDPKLDNILFDRATSRAVSLIDLDTVQPGLVHHDIGDCLRSCCNQGGESAAGAGTGFDLDLYRAILDAYGDEAGGLLDTAEIDLLYDAIRLIPFELGLRFLTDHLEGDRYFRVREHGQNLRKAQVQLRLVEDIEGKERQIRRIIAECFDVDGAFIAPGGTRTDNARECTRRAAPMNAIDWFAIPVIDLERARSFYCGMLGLDGMENLETPKGTCALFPCPDGGVGGSLNPFMGCKPTDDSGVTVWLNAGDDLQEALDRVEGAGGKVLQEKTPISDQYGFMAMILDTEGNRIGLHSMK